MKEINLSNSNLTAIVDDDIYETVSKFGWSLNSNGYAKRTIKIKGKSKALLMHKSIMGYKGDLDIDHINGRRLDNQKANFRLCTRSQNLGNQKLSSKNTSGHKGVHFDKERNKYQAYIKKNGRKIFLGRFNDPIEAAKAYNKKALELFGEFARLNIIPDDNAN